MNNTYLSLGAITLCGLLSWGCGANLAEKTDKPAQTEVQPSEAKETAPVADFDTQVFEGNRYGLPIDIGTTVEIQKASPKTIEVSITYAGTGECNWTRQYTAQATAASDEQITYAIPLKKPKECVIEITLLKGGKSLEIIRKNTDCGEMLENCLSSQVDKLEVK